MLEGHNQGDHPGLNLISLPSESVNVNDSNKFVYKLAININKEITRILILMGRLAT